MTEKCPKCGSESFLVARDMKATRKCAKCRAQWLPEMPKNDYICESHYIDIACLSCIRAKLNRYFRLLSFVKSLKSEESIKVLEEIGELKK